MHQESHSGSADLPPSEPLDLDAVCVRYIPPVRDYLRSRGLRRDDLADALQEVFLRLISALKFGRVDLTRIEPWLIEIARRVAANARRRRRPPAASLDSCPEIAVSDPPPGADEELRIVREAIAQLPDPYQTALRMKHWNQACTAEIAESFGISPSAVYVRLHRARVLLLRRLEGVLWR